MAHNIEYIVADFRVVDPLPNITFPVQQSYAGNIPVNRAGHPNNTLFFVGFEKSNGSLTAAPGAHKDSPWGIWLNGGCVVFSSYLLACSKEHLPLSPGSSSMYGLLFEVHQPGYLYFCFLLMLVHRTGLCALTSKIIQLPLTTTAGVISLTTFGSINLCMSSHTIVPRSQRLFILSSFLRGVGYSTADADGYGVWNRFPTHSHSLTGLF